MPVPYNLIEKTKTPCFFGCKCINNSISATNYTNHISIFNPTHYPLAIDLTNSSPSIKASITEHIWTHFNSNFNPTCNDPCTFHFQCPYTKCIPSLHTNFTSLHVRIHYKNLYPNARLLAENADMPSVHHVL